MKNLEKSVIVLIDIDEIGYQEPKLASFVQDKSLNSKVLYL